jgi:hypothetical protein
MKFDEPNDLALMSVIVKNAPADSARLPPQPVVPSNPVETGLPQRSESITFNGALLNYLPVACTCVSVNCKIDVKSINSPVVGLMDPQGVQHSSGTFSAQWGELLYTVMIDPKSAVANSSFLLETDYWQLLFQDIVPPNQAYTISHSVTSGLSETNTTTFSYTEGIKVGGSFAGATAEISAQLTQSFSRSITVSTQQTDTRTVPVTKGSYQQIVGLYQLMQTFAVLPAANLQQYVTALNKTFDQGSAFCSMTANCMHSSAGNGAVYPSQTYLWVVAHDQPGHVAAQPILSASLAAELVKASIRVTSSSS